MKRSLLAAVAAVALLAGTLSVLAATAPVSLAADLTFGSPSLVPGVNASGSPQVAGGLDGTTALMTVDRDSFVWQTIVRRPRETMWSAPLPIPGHPRPSGGDLLSVSDNGTLTVTSYDYNASFTTPQHLLVWRLGASNTSWTAPLTIPMPAGAVRPTVGVLSDGSVLVGWADGPSSTLRVVTLPPGGSVLSAPVVLGPAPPSGYPPNFAAGPGGQAVAFWYQGTSASLTYSWARKVPGASGFTPLDDLVMPAAAGGQRVALAPDGTVHEVGAQRVGNTYVVLHWSHPAAPATAWSAPEQLSPPGASADFPTVAVTGDGTTAVAWTASDGAVRVSTKPASALVWEPTQTLAAGAAGGRPEIAADATTNAIGVAWSARTDGILDGYGEPGVTHIASFTARAAVRAPGAAAFSPYQVLSAPSAPDTYVAIAGVGGSFTVGWFQSVHWGHYETGYATTGPSANMPLSVTLDPGTTNGKVFTVGVTVTNSGSTPITNVAFVDTPGVVVDPNRTDPLAAGAITAVDGPTPDLPTTLAPGQSATTAVTFAVDRQGTETIVSRVSGTDAHGSSLSARGFALLQIGTRVMTPDEIKRLYADIVSHTSQSVGTLMVGAQQRYAAVLAWATGSGGGGLPAWLQTSVVAGSVPPTGTTLPAPTGWQVSAARAAGLDDQALTWLPPGLEGYAAYLNMEAHIRSSGAKVIANTLTGAVSGLQNAADFYGELSVGNAEFKAEASRQFNGLVSDLGSSVADKVTILGAVLKYANDDPGHISDPADDPVLQQFLADSTATIDANLKSAGDKLSSLVQKAKVDPVGAAGDIGDVIGTQGTTMARDIALSEFGAGAISRFGSAIEASLPFARAGSPLVDAASAVRDPALRALAGTTDATGSQIVRQSLESLGEGAVISVADLEALGGFYGVDATKVQQIIKDINAKYGVEIEIQVRPGNPASLQFYKDGTGVPKPEWIKAKASEWTDRLLGAPESTLGKATLYDPVEPSHELLATLGPEQQQTLLDRFRTQQKLYKESFDPNGSFQKLLADSKTANGATVDVALGTKRVTGLKYELEAVEGHPGTFLVKDVRNGSKFVLSDADYQAVVNAKTGTHIPAAKQRGQIELDLQRRLERETVSFGGHGWTHSGADLSSKYSESFFKFATGSMSPADARATLEWFVSKGPLPPWAQKLVDELVKASPGLSGDRLFGALVDKLMSEFKPGQFVVKFNGTNMRVGFAAGLGK